MYTARDLAEIAGVSRHTIYSWTRHGVLPPAVCDPASPGRHLRHYTPAHVQRIRDIQRIREGNVTLLDLRDRFNPEDAE